MANKSAYTSCMRPHITGTGFSKEERKLRFCVGAKLCSGKTKSEEEAKRMCLEPKPPKQAKPTEKRPRKEVSCEDRIIKVTSCMVENIDMSQASNINSIQTALINSMVRCECQSK